MTLYAEEDLLPLSGLQHLSFCERRWALVHIERQWAENINTAEGALLHERAHSSKIESRPDVLIRRTLPLRSLRLGLSGQADIVEFLPCQPGETGIAMPRRKGIWRPYPVEYKRSRDKHGEWAYRIQLCAQALCLEEMLLVAVPDGAVLDGKMKRRELVRFDAELRARVEALAARMHALFEARQTPPPVYSKKCEGCSMNVVCAPQALEQTSARRYMHLSVAAHLGEPKRTS
jgi:CRISPR-associated exonuclease Cas4